MKAARWIYLIVLCSLVLKLGMQAMPCCMEWPSLETHSAQQFTGLASTAAKSGESEACVLKVAVASPVLAVFNFTSTQCVLQPFQQAAPMPSDIWLDAAITVPFKPPKA
ncbi:MAG TPA: hypothetical protein VGE55_05645 [Limnobacter sp.]|uniref:hypothetical protein n=1 Tax=Limnobacter sp. TaxID=2003368 RepID=UPI002EDA3A18